MFKGTDWITDWHKTETFSLRMGEICSTVPLLGSWVPNDRIALSMASFRLAQEHHSSMHLLFSHNKCASANALARPLMEAALRTIWIAEDADDQVIIEIVEGSYKLPLFADLNNHCLGKRGEKLNEKCKKILDTYTHGGTTALAAQFFTGDLREQSSASMLALAGFVLGAAGYMASSIAGRTDLLEQFTAAMPEFD